PLLWRIQAALGRLYQRQRRRDDAERVRAAGRALVGELAEGVPDKSLREQLLRRAEALLPTSASPDRAARLASGGLSAREREVAALIAQGRTYREIAARLVLSERTV